MAVYENTTPCLLIGNDVIGGVNSKLEIVTLSAKYSLYVLSDVKGHVAVV
jgi:hypothetical protein